VLSGHVRELSDFKYPLDWSDSDDGGNGGFSFCDLSYFGNQWISCTNEYASDRGLVLEGGGQIGTVIGFWDEASRLRGALPGNGVYLGNSNMIIGGYLRTPDVRSAAGMARFRAFRQVEEVNEKAKRRTLAMLHQQDVDSVFLWNANRAWGPGGDRLNTIGWRYLSAGTIAVPGYSPIAHSDWTLSYQENSPWEFLSIQDGFGPLGVSWRDHSGHFCGRDGLEYFLGVAWNAEKSSSVRRGFRAVGDRFEPPLGASGLRGRFLGRIVVKAGFRGYDRWALGQRWQAFFDNSGGSPHVIEEEGFAFICTRSTQSNPVGATRPDFTAAIRSRTDSRRPALSPVFSNGMILSSWIPNSVQQVGMLKRPNSRAADGRYNHYVCDSVRGWGRTGAVEPTWRTGLGDIVQDTFPTGMTQSEVTWRCLGPDPDDGCIIDEVTGTQWTCAGPVAEFAEYGPIYEKGAITTEDDSLTQLDAYPIPDNESTQFDVCVRAYQTQPMTPSPDGSDSAIFNLRAVYRRRGASIYGVMTSTVMDSNPNQYGPHWKAVLVQDGLRLLLQVEGAANTTIEWKSTRLPT